VNHRYVRLLGFYFIAGVSLAGPANGQSDSIAHTVKQLRSIPVSEEPGFDLPYSVPESVQPLLTQLKHQLRDLISETITENPSLSGRRLRREVLRRLATTGVHLADRTEYKSIEEVPPFTYGGIWDVSFHKPKGHRNLIAVVTTLEIGCGDDSSLYLFERRKSGWELVLARESLGYEEVRDAQGHFDFGVSLPDKHGNWFVVATSITPWCTSNWRSLRYHVLKPGESAYTPTVMFSATEGIYIGTDEPLRLYVKQDSFSVDHIDRFDLDDGLHNRVHVRRFVVKGDSVTRVAPLALAPHDFLDEWKRLPWEEASRWISGSRGTVIRDTHEALRAENTPHRGIGIVQPCRKVRPRTWVVSLGDEKTLFFTIQQVGVKFRILDVEDRQPANCRGDSPPPARTKLP
jgi:hypothetical protein